VTKVPPEVIALEGFTKPCGYYQEQKIGRLWRELSLCTTVTSSGYTIGIENRICGTNYLREI